VSASILVNELKHTSLETSLDTAVATVWMERIYRHYLLPALNAFGWVKTSLRLFVTFCSLRCFNAARCFSLNIHRFLAAFKENFVFSILSMSCACFRAWSKTFWYGVYAKHKARNSLSVLECFPSSHFIQWNMKIQSISNISFDHFPFQRDFSLFLSSFCDF
jgi:hypothetical protein